MDCCLGAKVCHRSNSRDELRSYCGCRGMSHGPAYFGTKAVPGSEFLRLGFLVSILNLAVFLVVGPAW